MAYGKRKRTRSLRRRRPVRRRMSYKKRRPSRKKYTLYKKIPNDHYSACFNWDRDLITAKTINSGPAASGAISQKVIDFNLGQFTKIVENWFNMFERVRINMISLSFRPVRATQMFVQTHIDGAVGANKKVPQIWHRVDYNSHDIDFSGTYDQIIERFEARPGVRKNPMTRGFSYKLRPRLQNMNLSHYIGSTPQMIYNPGPKRPWLELVHTDVLQAGLHPTVHTIYENQGDDGAYRLEPTCKVYVTFAGRRR